MQDSASKYGDTDRTLVSGILIGCLHDVDLLFSPPSYLLTPR